MGVATPRLSAEVVGFAAAVGPEGPVAVRGGGTRWSVGGRARAGTRIIEAPRGIVSFEPAEMTVRVLAGTSVAELQTALAEAGQCVNVAGLEGSTVGGALAVGWSAVRRLGWGPLRDSVLQVRYVSAEGLVITAGGPTVKNVTGFDLCRLLVGSLGTLGLIAEVIFRTRPMPVEERWFVGPADPFAVRDALYRPAAVLWNGLTTWVLLSGYPVDVASEAGVAATFGLLETDGPPLLPAQRHSVSPGSLPQVELEGEFVAEIGVGTVHRHIAPQRVPMAREVAELHDRIKATFDPSGRLNPGRDPRQR